MTRTFHVIGASGRSGAALCRALLGRGDRVVPVVRSVARWLETGIDLPCRLADLRDPARLAQALADATGIASAAHARHAGAILAASPAAATRHVLLGSTRRYSRWPDAHGDGVREGERAFLEAGRPGLMLHPTMIYGAEGENNVRRLAALARRLPVLPLPGGGRSLVQPIHQSDVTRALVAALDAPSARPEVLVIAGPRAVRYREFVRAVTAAAGIRARPVVPVPGRALVALAPLASLLPGLPRIGRDEVRRLLEDKAFDVGPMRARLGVAPIGLADGLRLTFGRDG